MVKSAPRPQASKYTVYDESGTLVAVMAEDYTGLGNEINRQLLRTRRSFTATVFSADGTQARARRQRAGRGAGARAVRRGRAQRHNQLLRGVASVPTPYCCLHTPVAHTWWACADCTRTTHTAVYT